MIPYIYHLDILLQEATFFVSHELHDCYFTEPLIGNYALAYALGLIKSSYNRTKIGYLADLPFLNKRQIYITPAWPIGTPGYRIEQFNCQSESYASAMIQNAIVELAGRQYYRNKYVHRKGLKKSKKLLPTNRPQIGRIKMLAPQNQFNAFLITPEKLHVPSYIRLGKFMSKAKIEYKIIIPCKTKELEHTFPLLNPLDLNGHKLLFADTINIHPVPLVRKAVLFGLWWVGRKSEIIVPSGLRFGGI